MAPTKKRNVSSAKEGKENAKKAKIDPDTLMKGVLESKKHANDVYDLLEMLQSHKEKDVIGAISSCNTLFSSLLERKDLHRGNLPDEEGDYTAQQKYQIFMRHRYNSCKEILFDHLDYEEFSVKEAAICCLMKFAESEGQHPLEDLDWSEHYSFPREFIQVGRLLSVTTDNTLLLSRFQEYLQMVDVRYYVMSAIRDSVTKVMDRNKGVPLPVYQNNVFNLMSNISMASSESELTNFMVTREKHEDWKAAKLKEHKRAFEKMWLCFLKYKLPTSMYKRVLVILHDSILPHMSKPTLMIDFLTAAYEVGAISLLALNGLFVLIHQHNDYPDFYQKLYNLLEPSVFHVKYRSRFFHLANLFLSSHLPVYLIAAFAKRLARLALTAPPTALLIVLPFIYNLIRRHPSCRVLIHKPSSQDEDQYDMDEEDPAKSCALESSLWEIKTLQKHYHPHVAKIAMLINTPLTEQEDDIDELLELTTFELMERDLKPHQLKNIPLEFETATQLLKGGGDVLQEHFCLD
uniref:CCAAT-binding factor domain-containing protein n=1 Tax=Periophthalmus magnuspinnatus TaxID=409849 RepID=A0A3B3ZLF6_9GOBI